MNGEPARESRGPALLLAVGAFVVLAIAYGAFAGAILVLSIGFSFLGAVSQPWQEAWWAQLPGVLMMLGLLLVPLAGAMSLFNRKTRQRASRFARIVYALAFASVGSLGGFLAGSLAGTPVAQLLVPLVCALLGAALSLALTSMTPVRGM